MSDNDTRTVFERMSAAADRARADQGDKPSPLEAARAHLGGGIPEQEPRGNLEEAMVAGADPVTGELPAREEDAETDRIIEAQGGLAAVHTETASPPPAPTPAPLAQAPQAEVIEAERAVDGLPAPFAARTTGDLINLLENGQFSADVIAAMTALASGMSELAINSGKRQKGALTIKVNLTTDDNGEAFFAEGEFTVRAPKVPRRKTMLWQDDKGHMSPSQPRQRVFFGVKEAGGGPRQIRDASAEARRL